MQIYIASSWKNQHAVEMLTQHLRDRGHEVLSWVENNYGEDHGPGACAFEEWVRTDAADRSFAFDIKGAATCDLCIYVGPAGTDAWAEVGVAYGSCRPIIGLWAKGEPSGLMRKMMTAWVGRYADLLAVVDEYAHDTA
jgi:hypothetical protein